MQIREEAPTRCQARMGGGRTRVKRNSSTVVLDSFPDFGLGPPGCEELAVHLKPVKLLSLSHPVQQRDSQDNQRGYRKRENAQGRGQMPRRTATEGGTRNRGEHLT